MSPIAESTPTRVPKSVPQSNKMSVRRLAKKVRNKTLFRYRVCTPKPSMPFDAIFVVGYYKTGTTSMHHFLKTNGLRHLTINREVKKRFWARDFRYLEHLVRHFHSFDDNPWHNPTVIEHFARAEMDYRFILTTRDENEWFDSYCRHNLRHGALPCITNLDFSVRVSVIRLDLFRGHQN